MKTLSTGTESSENQGKQCIPRSERCDCDQGAHGLSFHLICKTKLFQFFLRYCVRNKDIGYVKQVKLAKRCGN